MLRGIKNTQDEELPLERELEEEEELLSDTLRFFLDCRADPRFACSFFFWVRLCCSLSLDRPRLYLCLSSSLGDTFFLSLPFAFGVLTYLFSAGLLFFLLLLLLFSFSFSPLVVSSICTEMTMPSICPRFI